MIQKNQEIRTTEDVNLGWKIIPSGSIVVFVSSPRENWGSDILVRLPDQGELFNLHYHEWERI